MGDSSIICIKKNLYTFYTTEFHGVKSRQTFHIKQPTSRWSSTMLKYVLESEKDGHHGQLIKISGQSYFAVIVVMQTLAPKNAEF